MAPVVDRRRWKKVLPILGPDGRNIVLPGGEPKRPAVLYDSRGRRMGAGGKALVVDSRGIFIAPDIDSTRHTSHSLSKAIRPEDLELPLTSEEREIFQLLEAPVQKRGSFPELVGRVRNSMAGRHYLANGGSATDFANMRGIGELRDKFQDLIIDHRLARMDVFRDALGEMQRQAGPGVIAVKRAGGVRRQVRRTE